MSNKVLKFQFQSKEVIVDVDASEITFKGFLVEKFIPRRVSEVKVLFDEIGRNSVSHRFTCSASLKAFEILETTKGRIWIPSKLREERNLFEILDECWRSNKRERKEKNEYSDFRKRLSRTPPLVTLLGLFLLLALIGCVVFFYSRILPNI